MKCLLLSILLTATLLPTFAGDSIRVQFITPSIVRITASVHEGFPSNETGVLVYPQSSVEVKKTVAGDEIKYESSELVVNVDRQQRVSFKDKGGREILCQGRVSCTPSYQEHVVYDENSAHMEETANGKVTVKNVLSRDTIGRSTRYTTPFYSADEKALYGLGCQMEDYMNLHGKTLWLTQHNLKVHVPMLLSTNGYGLLFDAGCAMVFKSERDTTTIQLEAAKSMDYYFIYGGNKNSLTVGDGWGEALVAGYRYLTGNVSMMPRYLFGYTQSKERYCSSDEIVSTLKEYRRRHVPIDMIVQDWNYWPQGWGYMKMNPNYYPSPKALADSVHALNAKLMVSIWPNPQWCPEADDFKKRGMMLEHDIYDAFNPEARKLYWKYANDEFFSNGFDAWWCDSSEPLDGDWNRIPATDIDGKPYGWNSQNYRWELNAGVLSEALGQERSSLFSLYHSMGIYENQRAVSSEAQQHTTFSVAQPQSKRVVNLTRSSFAGQQRYGTVVWNGDTHASWESFRQQIPAGLNYMATGNPYWTVDVGSFFTKDDGRRWFYKGEFPKGVKDDAYKEYYVRMFQWATFLPMLRSHGSDTPREIWQFGEPGTTYYDAILKMINIRYAHVPYIYSMAARQSGLTNTPLSGQGMKSKAHEGFSMARPLAFDFHNDTTVLDMKDEYMFGDYLVCPVTHPLSETTMRKVYLPAGTKWIDYWSNEELAGGQWIDYNLAEHENRIKTSSNGKAGVELLPLYVCEGSIIPTTEVAEYTDAQTDKPVTVNVYPGNDAEFTLYEDEGNNYNFEKGAYSIIKMRWDDKKHTLTIGNRKGTFNGMLEKRIFIIKTPSATKEIIYKGKEKKVKLQ